MAQALLSPTSDDFVQKTLGAQLLAGATTMTLNNVTSIPNLPGVCIVDRINTNDVETPNSREVIKYTGVSGSTLTGLTRNADGSGSDQDHAINAIVEFGPDILWAQSVYDALTQVVVASTGLLDSTKVVPATGGTITSPNIVIGSDVKGDMYYKNSGASLARLPLGSLNQVLMANASLPQWTDYGWRSPFTVLTDASTMYLDFSVGNKWMATIVPSGARTFLATNATVGYVGLLRVKYASTASLALNLLTIGATISWPGGSAPTPTATVGKVDAFVFECNATTPAFDGFIAGQSI